MKTFLLKNAKRLYFPAVALLMTLSKNSSGQASILYTGAASGTWQVTSNWTGSIVPTSTDIAQVGLNPTGSSNIGIDMGASTNNGTNNQAVGAFEMTNARTSNLILINNSSVSGGTLSFVGTTVNAIPNVIIRNNSSSNLTINTPSLTVALTNTVNNRIMQDGTGKITIATPISGAANCPLTIDGVAPSITEVDITYTANPFSGLIYLYNTETVFSGEGSFGAVPGALVPNAITIDGGRMTMPATYTLNANRGIKIGPTAGTAISVKSGAVVTYNGIIADLSTNGSWAKQGSNTLQLGGISIYTGTTAINNGILKLVAGNNRLPLTTTINVGQSASSNVGLFDLNGFNQQIAGLNSVAGTNSSSTAKNTVTTTVGSSTLTLNGAGTYNYGAGTAANSGIISGNVSLVKSGTSIQILGDINTYTGSTTINAGELRFSPNANETLNSAVILNGGTLGTSGISATRVLSFSTLALTDNSMLSLEPTNTHTLNFAASSGVSWTAAKTLTIIGWQGNFSNGTAGTVGRLFVGSTGSDLTALQLSSIVFFNGSNYFPAMMLSTGEIVPFCVAPAITSVSSNTAQCAGSAINLSVSATGTFAPTFSWAGPNSFTSAVQNPSISNSGTLASGAYTVSALNGCGTASSVITVTINSLPIVVANTTSTTVCSGQSITLSGNGASTYTWSNSVINGAAFVPTSTAVYTVTGTSTANCNNSATVSVTVNITPTLSVNSGTICTGKSLTLTANGATSYTWNSTVNSASIVVSPTTTTNYTITASNPGCSATLTTAVTVYTTPILSVNSATVCSGTTATLSASGANSYTWSPAGNSSTISVTPTTTTIYTLTGASSQSCTSTLTTQILVNPLPSLVSFTTSVCAGGTATLTVGGASTYTWSDNSTNTSVVVTPTSNVNYTITGASTQSCVSTVTTGVIVTASPSITLNSATICAGSTATLTATGVGTFTWNTNVNSPTIAVTPTSTAVYTVTGNASGCAVTASNTATVSVNPLPPLTVSSATICSGATGTLTVSGATTYSWNTSSTSATITPSPTASQVYTVTGTSLGCSSTATTQVLVNATPTLAINTQTICSGAAATLSVSGASTYSWSTTVTAATISASPSLTTSYSVTGTSTAGCLATIATTITVNSTPTITVNSATICAGNSTVLTASGANSYTWNVTGNASTLSVNPASTSVYTVNGTSSLGCASSATVLVTVNGLPILTVNSPSICLGASTTLSASGAATYSWSNNSTAASIVVTPTSTSNYTVTGTSSLGCKISNTITVTVNPLPTVSVTSASICGGASATLSASGAATYLWTNLSFTAANVTVAPAATTQYTVTGTSAQGCTKTATTFVIVLPTPLISVNSSSICAGSTATVSASGASAYLWNTGITSSSFTSSPASTVSYTVTGTSTLGCTSTAVVLITVNALPVVSFGTLPSAVCAADGTIGLSAAPPGGIYSGTGISNNMFSPSSSGTGTYTLTYMYTDTNNCSAAAHKTITVDVCTAIKAYTSTETIHVSPNPAQNEITIGNGHFVNEYSIEILDLTGKQVHSLIVKQPSVTIDVNALSNGVYVLRITENEKQSNLKFIKN